MRLISRTRSVGTPDPLPPDKRPRFGVDHNFPLPILLDVVRRWTPELRLVPLKEIDSGLTKDLGDHRVIQGLWQKGFLGLLTCDDSMLWLPEVVGIIAQTRFSVVACVNSGDDPLRATGLLLSQLPHIAKRHDPTKPQVWFLKVSERQPRRFHEHVASVEKRSSVRIASLRMTQAELNQPVLRSTSRRLPSS